MAQEEITVRAKRLKKRGASITRAPRVETGGDLFERLLRKEPSDFQRLMKGPVTPKPEVIEEVVATAKRLPKPTVLTRLLGPLSAATSVAEIGAMIADQISQQKLDEAGEIATREVKAKPDTPVKTIKQPKPEVIDEIIVTAPRAAVRPKFNFPTARVAQGVKSFGELLQMPSTLGQPRPDVKPETTIKAPDLSLLRVTSAAVPVALLATMTAVKSSFAPKTKTKAQREKIIKQLPTVFSDPQTFRAPMPAPNPLADMASPPRTRYTALTDVQPRMVEFRVPATQTQRAAFCPPCPKKTETKKKRRQCWKKLVREFADPRKDKVYKWERIDCRTGRPFKRKR